MAGCKVSAENAGRGMPGASLLVPLRAVVKELGIREGRWAVRIVGDREMTRLHERYMGLKSTTDVLTFDLREPRAGRMPASREGAAVELDTVVCLAEARRRAKELGHSPWEELVLYCVHSLLHVQGYDDVTAAKARKMHAREDELLRAIGLGALYARGKSPAKRGRR